MKLLPLQGYKSLRALNAFHSLLLGLKMLPVYAGLDYQSFFAGFSEKTEEEKERSLREALAFVQLSPEEVSALISFSTDPNGIAYGDANIKTMTPDVLFETIIAVCMEIGRIKIDLVSAEEKKKLQTSL